MILECVELRRFGRFVEPVRVGPFLPGLNILAAPNEQGKSTLLRAAARCLFDRHTTKADEIRSVQPAGTDLAPEVTVEFRVTNRRFKLRKRFLQSPESALAEWREEAWREMATADAADQCVLELLMAAQPGRGASKPEHWGLLRYLWARQEEPALWPEWDGDSGERIRRCLAKLEVDPGMDSVLAKLAEQFQSVFTPTGQVKKGGDLYSIQQQLDQLDVAWREVTQRIQVFESQQDAYRQLALELEQVRKLAENSRRESERLREQLNALALTRQEIEAAKERLEQSNGRLQAVDADLKRLASLRKIIEEASAKQEAKREQLKEIQAAEELRQTQFREADAELVRLDRDRQALGQRAARTRLLVKWRGLESELATKQGKLAQIDALAKELTEKRRQRSGVATVSNKQLEQLRSLDREIRDLEIHLQTAGLEIELAPDNSGAVRAETERGTFELHASELAPAVLHARRRAKITLPGWGRITVSSGARELRELEEKLKVATEQFTRLKEGLGVGSPDDAEKAFHAGKDLDREIKNLEQQSRTLLAEHDSPQAFGQAIDVLESKLAGVRGQLEPFQPGEREANLAAIETQVADAEAALESLEQRGRQTSRRYHDLETQRQDLLRKAGEAQNQAAAAKGELERAAAQIQSIEQRYPSGIDGEFAAAQQAFVQAEARLAVSKSKLPPDADLLPGRRDRAVRAAADAEQSYDLKRSEMNRLEGALGTAAAAGLFSQAAELEERANVVRAQLAALRRRSQAARFICALIERRKAAAVRTVLGPLEQRLSASFADLTGNSQRSVFLDENLAIIGVGRSRDPRELIAFQNLSQGAKEQLLLCLRAAAAVELSATEPQTLILDDVLVNTDPVRQCRVLDFLSNLALQVQVIVLTCHPDRYAGLGHSLTITRQAG